MNIAKQKKTRGRPVRFVSQLNPGYWLVILFTILVSEYNQNGQWPSSRSNRPVWPGYDKTAFYLICLLHVRQCIDELEVEYGLICLSYQHWGHCTFWWINILHSHPKNEKWRIENPTFISAFILCLLLDYLMDLSWTLLSCVQRSMRGWLRLTLLWTKNCSTLLLIKILHRDRFRS